MRGAAHQLHEAIERVAPVPFLRAELPGVDDQDALLGHTPASQAGQPLPDVIRQAGRVGNIKAQLHGRGGLVDVLTARS